MLSFWTTGQNSSDQAHCSAAPCALWWLIDDKRPLHCSTINEQLAAAFMMMMMMMMLAWHKIRSSVRLPRYRPYRLC
ncbi:hypothetical protein T12_4834 [Trichinella patagoniensis]|uniref:Uncharacterized protein n=1 Tax=Trichinella patagoniensis TaxID=990121 RepID=A0A0V1A2U7_9BILA|nr:hypothetical protein T12_4834 [Trichinella patagoniensis]